MVNSRRLKVYETTYQPRESDVFRSCKKKNVSIPQIRLQGKWLQEYGFEAGCRVHILCERGKLTITKE